MASSNIVKVIPFSDSTTKLSLPLTFYDTIWFKFPPVEHLFFYQFSELTPPIFNSLILPKLKHTLSLTLSHYLPLAGSLIWPPDSPKPSIYYSTNDGVSFTVSESNADFNFLSDNGIREAVSLRPFIPELLVSDGKAAIIAAQITLFPNEGFCIGIATHHTILDGKSSTTFIKSWAYLCKKFVEGEDHPSLMQELTPCFDRTAIKDPTGIDMVYVNNWLDYMAKLDSNSSARSLKFLPALASYSNGVRATFELTGEDIKKIRNKVLFILDKLLNENEDQQQSKKLHLSTFVLTCAYLFVCMVKAKAGEHNRSVMLFFQADYRTRLDPPLPINYFGNCVMTQWVHAKAKDLMEENGVAIVSEKLSDIIKGLEKGVVEATEETLVTLMRFNEEAEIVGTAGSIQFDVYGSDFGWGRPKKVEIVSIDRTGAISLAKSRDGGGSVEIGIVLEKQEMEVFASLFADGLKHY